MFWAVGLAASKYFKPGVLSDIATIHFARWVTIPNSRDLLFMSNYGGSWESYLEDFITKAHSGLTGIWSNTVGFPKASNLFMDGATDGDRFKRWCAIEVIGVGDGERARDRRACRQHGLSRAADAGQLLDRTYRQVTWPTALDVGENLVFDVVSHHQHDLVVPASERSRGRIVHDGLIVWTDRSELLQAAEAPAVPCGENHQLHSWHPREDVWESGVQVVRALLGKF